MLAFKREGYRKTSFSLARRRSSARATRRLLAAWRRSYWRMGLGEMLALLQQGRLRARAAAAGARDRGAATCAGRRRRARAGARAATAPCVDDFRIVEAERMIHVLNAPSPGRHRLDRHRRGDRGPGAGAVLR